MTSRAFLDWVDEQQANNRTVKAICGNKVFVAFPASVTKNAGKQKFHWYYTWERIAGTLMDHYDSIEATLSARFGWSQ
jgi:hypothetical protein